MTNRMARLLLVLTFCLYPGAVWPETELTMSIRLLAQNIQARLGEQTNGRLAVVPFRMNSGPPNALETFVAEELIAAFVSEGKVAVVERGLISEIISEIRNSASGLIDQTTVKKAKFKGADYILTGTITVLSNYVAVNARMINTETGLVSASAQRNLLRDEDVRKLLETPAIEPVLVKSEPLKDTETTTTPAGSSLRRLQRENLELGQQVEQLQKENRGNQAKAKQLEGLLNETQKDLGAAQQELERLRKPLKASGRRSPEVPATAATDERALRAAEAALGKIDLAGASISTEKGAFQVWKALYAQEGEQAIRSLLSLLSNPKHEWQDQWKIVTLLTYASRSAEEHAQARAIIGAVADLVLRDDYVGKAALELIAGAPVLPRIKWEALFPILQQAPIDKVGALVQRMPEFTPPEERDRTAKVIADILSYTNHQYSTIPATISALEALNARSELPRFREALAEAPVQKANSLAGLLAYFGDRESVPAIRQAIETWRHGSMSIRSLLSSLQTLEGSACYIYFAEILASSHPAVQGEILSVVQYSDSGDPSLIAAIRRLAEATTNQGLKKLAEQYLARLASPAAVPPP